MQRGDHAAHVGHHAADHQPGAEPHQHHQHQADDDAQARGGRIGLAGLCQGLLEVAVGLRAEGAAQLLGLGQLAGHAVEARAQIVERGAAVDQLAGGGEGVVGIAAHRRAPLLQRLLLGALVGQQRGQRLLLRVDLLQYLARLVEHAGFAGGHGVVQQRRHAGELEDHCVGLFQRRVAAGFQPLQPGVGRRELQRGVEDVQHQPEQRHGGDQGQFGGQREILQHASTPVQAVESDSQKPAWSRL